MDIVEKLNLQPKHGGVVLFKEGLFLRAYNESCYILVHLLGLDLKVNCYSVKRLEQWVVMCAFPYNKLAERLPNARLTDFGAWLKGDYDLTHYSHWFKTQYRNAHNVSKATHSRKKDAAASFSRVTATPPKNDQLISVNFLLTKQQIDYLISWQKGAYPLEVDLGFIETLKTNIGFVSFNN